MSASNETDNNNNTTVITQTAKTVFEDTAKSFINNVSTHLSNWLKEHEEVEIDPETICAAFDVKFQPPITPGLPPALGMHTPVSIPSYMMGSTTPKRRGGRQKKEYDEDHPKCIYEFVRGKKSGKKCGTPVLMDGTPGSEHYCKSCIKKSGVKSHLKQGGGKSKVNPPVLERSIKIDEPQEKKQDQLTVEKIEGYDDLFKEPLNGFIIKQDVNNGITVVKIEKEGKWVDLSQEEKQKALDMGLHIINDDSESLNIEPVPDFPEPEDNDNDNDNVDNKESETQPVEES